MQNTTFSLSFLSKNGTSALEWGFQNFYSWRCIIGYTFRNHVLWLHVSLLSETPSECQNSFDPDQARCFAGPDLSPNYLQRYFRKAQKSSIAALS